MEEDSRFEVAFNSFTRLLVPSSVSTTLVQVDLETALQHAYLSVSSALQTYPSVFPNKAQLMLRLMHLRDRLEILEDQVHSEESVQEGPDSGRLIRVRYVGRGKVLLEKRIEIFEKLPSSDIAFGLLFEADKMLVTSEKPFTVFEKLVHSNRLQVLLNEFRSLEGTVNQDGRSVTYSEIDRSMTYPVEGEESIERSFSDFLTWELGKYSYDALYALTGKVNNLLGNKETTSVYINEQINHIINLVKKINEKIENQSALLAESRSDDGFTFKGIIDENILLDYVKIKEKLVSICKEVYALYKELVYDGVKGSIRASLEIEIDDINSNNNGTSNYIIKWRKSYSEFFGTFIPLIEDQAMEDSKGNNQNSAIYKVLSEVFCVPQKRKDSFFQKSSLIKTFEKEIEIYRNSQRNKNKQAG